LITFNNIFVRRLANVGIITREKAVDYGLAGPNLRGSGVNWDIRRDMPYGAYPDFEFNIPVGTGRFGTLGDCWESVLRARAGDGRILEESCARP